MKDEASSSIMEPAHPDILIPMPDKVLHDNTNTMKHQKSKSKNRWKGKASPAELLFIECLTPTSCRAAACCPLQVTLSSFILHNSLEILLFPTLYGRKQNIRSFSCRKDGVFIELCWDLLCGENIHWHYGKYVRKGWLKHMYKCVCKAIAQKYLQESSQGLHTIETLLLCHIILPTTFSQSPLPNPKLGM